MLRNFLVVIFLLVFSNTLFSQNFKGKVLDTSGEPISGATVYIKEIKQGLICNAEGEFQLTLPEGDYNCIFRCLGYITQEKSFSIKQDAEPVSMNISLKNSSVELSEVVVRAGEDAAYEMIRKAVEKAPLHLAQVKEYTCEAYIKGSGKSIHIPGWIEKMGGEQIKLYKDRLFLQESHSEIKYTYPDLYVQNIKAVSSSMPNDSIAEDVLGISRNSIYVQRDGAILHPKTFSYYRFRYEDYEEVNGVNINKIKVIPKFQDPKLYSGYIYLADDHWAVRGAELNLDTEYGKVNYTLNYDEVADNIFLVTSYKTHIDANILGMKFVFDYLASVKYTDIQVNDSITALVQQNLKPEKKKEKKNLEIKSLDNRYKREADSLATKRDSLYWSDIRTISLNDEEIASYSRKDSIKVKSDSIRDKRSGASGFSMFNALMGGQVGRNSSKIVLSYGGILGMVPEYNYVDGYWIGTSLNLKIKRKEHSAWNIKPSAYWATARERILWKLDVDFKYAPLKFGELNISGGSTSEDYMENHGMLRVENTYNSFLWGVNSAKFYQKDFVKVENRIEIINGLNLFADVEYADRNTLENNDDYSLFKKKNEITPNIPPYAGNLNEQYSKLAKYGIRLSYTPELYYMIEKGKKRYVRTRFPSIGVSFKQGIPLEGADYSKFYSLDLTASQYIYSGLFNRFHYMINAGKFLNNNEFNYIDYKHFNSANQMFTGKDFETSFSLLPYYTYSTNKEWIQAMASYRSDYLLLKRLPFLQGKQLRESIHGKFLHTPDKKYYSEWGYSIELSSMGGALGVKAGVFVGLDKFDYNSFGFRVSLPLLQDLGKFN